MAKAYVEWMPYAVDLADDPKVSAARRQTVGTPVCSNSTSFEYPKPRSVKVDGSRGHSEMTDSRDTSSRKPWSHWWRGIEIRCLGPSPPRGVRDIRGRMKQNLTIQLDRSIIAQAKVLAAIHERSLSKFVAELIEKSVLDDAQYRQAERHAQALLKKGFQFGRARKPTREELYDR